MTRRLLAVAALALGACTPRLSGELRIDGAAFAPTTCHNGQALGFAGVELGDAAGRRLRVAGNVDGTGSVAVFSPGRATGDDLGRCATLSVVPQRSRINGVTNLQGTATLNCTTGGHTISGSVTFQNCH